MMITYEKCGANIEFQAHNNRSITFLVCTSETLAGECPQVVTATEIRADSCRCDHLANQIGYQIWGDERSGNSH